MECDLMYILFVIFFKVLSVLYIWFVFDMGILEEKKYFLKFKVCFICLVLIKFK